MLYFFTTFSDISSQDCEKKKKKILPEEIILYSKLYMFYVNWHCLRGRKIKKIKNGAKAGQNTKDFASFP